MLNEPLSCASTWFPSVSTAGMRNRGKQFRVRAVAALAYLCPDVIRTPHPDRRGDDREIRGLIARLLKVNEFRVSTAGDGPRMDRILADSRIDLIILDVMLPHEEDCRSVAACARRRNCRSSWSRAGERTRPGSRPRARRRRLSGQAIRLPGVAGQGAGRPAPHIRCAGGRGCEAVHTFRFHGWTLDSLRRSLTDPAGARFRSPTENSTCCASCVRGPDGCSAATS